MKKITLTTLLLISTVILFSQADFLSTTNKQLTPQKTQRSFYLPFFEDWSSGSLETNNWQAETENWKINNQEGNERPSVEFDWSPLLEDDYSCSLESDQFNGEILQIGRIFLLFDIKLFDRNSTGAEKLLVEVFDGESWNTIASYSNVGSFDWDKEFIEITKHSLAKNFKIRFTAIGVNSYDIVAWYIDNIHLWRSCYAPDNLNADFVFSEGNIINQITWEANGVILPYYSPIHWDDGMNFEGFGMEDGGSYSVAVRWDKGMLVDYNGGILDKITYFVADSGFSNLVLKIWTGDSAVNLIYQDTIEQPLINSWNEAVIDSLLFLDSSIDLWVGYTILDQAVGKFPAGRDKGPAISGYGNMISKDEVDWGTVESENDSGNWNVHLFISYDESSHGHLEGFELYRYIDGVNEDYEFYDFIPAYEGYIDYLYLDTVENFRIPDHCYKVNQLWTKDLDTCVSDFALNIIPIYDYACIIYESTSDLSADLFDFYPNPVKNEFSITSTSFLTEVIISDLKGVILYDAQVNNAKSIQVDASFLSTGLYFVSVTTETGSFTKKFIKTE